MKYVVLSTDAAGQPKIEDVDSLDTAVQLVERLRNDDAVEDVRVLREVPLEVRTYYKVVALEDDSSGGAQDEQGTAPLPPPDVELATSDEPPAEALQSVPDAPAPSVPEPSVPEPSADAAVEAQLAEEPASTSGGSRPEVRADEGFFTPPPVRSHPIEEDGEAAPDSTPSERRTSLFGRG